MAAVLVQTDLQLPAGVHRPAVRAASATLAVPLGHCRSSDLSWRWLAFAGKGVVVGQPHAQTLAATPFDQDRRTGGFVNKGVDMLVAALTLRLPMAAH